MQVRQALDGRHIPRHLLNDTPNPPSLKITYSQHTDLNVKFQSHRSRQVHTLIDPPRILLPVFMVELSIERRCGSDLRDRACMLEFALNIQIFVMLQRLC